MENEVVTMHFAHTTFLEGIRHYRALWSFFCNTLTELRDENLWESTTQVVPELVLCVCDKQGFTIGILGGYRPACRTSIRYGSTIWRNHSPVCCYVFPVV